MAIKSLNFYCAALAVLAAMAATPPARATDTNFESVQGNHSWFSENNWSNGRPNNTKRAVILADELCEIDDSQVDAEAQAIVIQSPVQQNNTTLKIKNGNVLILGAGDEDPELSTIEDGGVLRIGNGASGELRISGAHVLVGDGGMVLMKDGSKIEDSSGVDDHLRIEGSCAGASERACSLVVTQEESDEMVTSIIAVPLYNDAFVVATECLRLMDHEMDGGCAGYWIAQGGILHVETLVRGDAAWLAQDSDLGGINGGTIRIGDHGNEGCVLADGPVTVTGSYALLDITDIGHFCTTGTLTHRSVPDGEFTTQPIVSSIYSASFFGVTTCNSAACP